MQHFILTAPTEQDLITALPEYRSEDEWTNIIGPCTRWITKPTYDEEGNQTAPGETQPGFTVILYAESVPEAAQPYIITDATGLEPLPSGGLRTPEVPQSVKALQGMRAIKYAGLIDKFVPWKAALDPIEDFEIIAFLEKAENWNYDDPIIDEALTSFGELHRKDDLFLLAATL